MTHLNLDNFPELPITEECGFCMTHSALQYANEQRAKQSLPPLRKSFLFWEDRVARPYFESQGYAVSYWYDLESDVFGPLVRAVRLTKDEVEYTFTYG